MSGGERHAVVVGLEQPTKVGEDALWVGERVRVRGGGEVDGGADQRVNGG